MSLLADLLSKKNNAEPSGARDIPPTLTQSHDAPVKVLSVNNRYMVITLLFAAAIVVGLLALFQFGRLTSFLTKKQAVAPLPVKPPTAATTAAPTAPAQITQPVPTQMVEPEKIAVSEHKKKTATRHSTAKPKHARHRPSAAIGTQPGLAAIQPAQSAAPVKQPVPAAIRPEAASTTKFDTAKRDALLYAARSAEQVSDWRLALANYRRAQKIDPDNFVIMNNAAAALNNLGMFDEGLKEAKRALGKKPDYVPAMINAAIAYSSKGNSREALRLFSEATIADPGNRSLVINLGILQERSGKLEEAQMTYRPLADDGDPLALMGMGRIYERKGNRNEAVRAYRQIMALPNANPALKKEIKGKLIRLEE